MHSLITTPPHAIVLFYPERNLASFCYCRYQQLKLMQKSHCAYIKIGHKHGMGASLCERSNFQDPFNVAAVMKDDNDSS